MDKQNILSALIYLQDKEEGIDGVLFSYMTIIDRIYWITRDNHYKIAQK